MAVRLGIGLAGRHRRTPRRYPFGPCRVDRRPVPSRHRTPYRGVVGDSRRRSWRRSTRSTGANEPR